MQTPKWDISSLIHIKKFTHTHAITSKIYVVQYLVLIGNVAMTQVPNESNEMSFETEGRMGVSAPWPCQGEIVCCGEHIFTSFTQ